VMPNIEILRRHCDSALLKAMEASNRAKMEREARKKLETEAVKETVSRS